MYQDFATMLDREQNANGSPWLSFLKGLRASAVKPPKGTSWMRWASEIYQCHKGAEPEGAVIIIETMRLKPVMRLDEGTHNVYSASLDTGFFDPADYETGVVAVDNNDPLSILLAREEEAALEAQLPPVDTTVHFGEDIVQPKCGDDLMPAANRSHPQWPSRVRSWGDVMLKVQVGPLDPMWRTFLALERYDRNKERMARRTLATRRQQFDGAIAHSQELIKNIDEARRERHWARY